MTTNIAAIVLPIIASVALAVTPPREQAPSPRAIPFAELVKQMGSEDYAQREAAVKRLASMAIDPPAELLAATKSENPEVRGRAAKAVRAMRGNVAIMRMPRGERFAREGKFDLFVAATAAWDLKPEDRRLWLPAFDLGRRLIAKAEMTGIRKPNGCPSAFKDYEEFVELCRPKYICVDTVHSHRETDSELFPSYNKAIQAPGVADPNGICRNLIVSRGDVTVAHAILSSLVLANGDITARTLMLRSILVCDGNVTLSEGFISGCVVVARGNIIVEGGADTSVLIAGGKVTLGKERVTKKQAENGHFNVVVEGEPNTAGHILGSHPNKLGITFFELLSTLGLVAKAENGTITVTNYTRQGAIAAAGMEIGDIITAVNGKKPDSAESLRRLLRDALAIGDATVQLQRGGKAVTVKVSLPE